MTKQKNGRKKQERRTKKILFTTGLTAVVFVVATYAWFIGTMQASVDAFEIDIKSSDGLTLSLDGQDFSNQITIGEEEVKSNKVKIKKMDTGEEKEISLEIENIISSIK